MIDGESNPEGEAYAVALEWLLATVSPIKMEAKKRIYLLYRSPENS